MPRPAVWTPRRVAVLGASGSIGRLLVEHLSLAEGRQIEAVDRARVPLDVGGGKPGSGSGVSYWVGDVTCPSKEIQTLVEESDVVFLALPESVACEAAAWLKSAMPAGSLLVDTLSVKSRWCEFTSSFPASICCVGINPMFAPSLGFQGRPVAIVGGGAEPRSAWLCDQIESWGGQIVEMDSDGHDRATAALQVATHASILAFGAALLDLGYDLDQLEPMLTPPHRIMLALIARICGNDPHVYFDIQTSNPYGATARLALASGLAGLGDMADNADIQQFESLVADLSSMLGSSAEEFENLGARVCELG